MPSSSDTSPRTIAFFSPRMHSGGTQRHLLEVLKFIDRARFRPLVISAKSGGGLGTTVARYDVERVELDLGDSMVSRDMLRCARAAADLFRQRHVAVVQYYEWRSGLIALLAGRLAGRRGVVAGRRSAPTERGAKGLVEELVVQVADRVVVNAEWLRPRGRAARRTDVIASGVDLDLFRPDAVAADARTRLGVPAGAALVGTVGRLEARKGTPTLVEATARLVAAGQEVVTVLVGDGPLRAEVEAQIARLGLEGRVRLLGDRADVRDILAALDVFVLPSRTEGMSNALLEAMAMARPVVATAVGGNPEVLGAEGTGVLVAADAPDAMADAVAGFVRDAARARAFGRAARARVEERYGSRAMVRRLESVYAAAARAPRDDGRTAVATPAPRSAAGWGA